MKRPWLLAFAAVAALALAGSAAFALLQSGGKEPAQAKPGLAAISANTPSPSPVLPTETPPPPTETLEPPSPTPAPAAPTAVRAAPSPVPATAPPAPTAALEPCGPAQITVKADFSTQYYMVTGSTVAEINTSLVANGLVATGQRAVGLTAYRTRISSSNCVRADSCAIGSMELDFSGWIILPKHQSPDALEPSLLAAWRNFESLVAVHEGRHATIAREGAAEIRNQLLALGPRANCADLDHEVNRLWNLGLESMARRQQLFHNADAAGQGGLVAR